MNRLDSLDVWPPETNDRMDGTNHYQTKHVKSYGCACGVYTFRCKSYKDSVQFSEHCSEALKLTVSCI